MSPTAPWMSPPLMPWSRAWAVRAAARRSVSSARLVRPGKTRRLSASQCWTKRSISAVGRRGLKCARSIDDALGLDGALLGRRGGRRREKGGFGVQAFLFQAQGAQARGLGVGGGAGGGKLALDQLGAGFPGFENAVGGALRGVTLASGA